MPGRPPSWRARSRAPESNGSLVRVGCCSRSPPISIRLPLPPSSHSAAELRTRSQTSSTTRWANEPRTSRGRYARVVAARSGVAARAALLVGVRDETGLALADIELRCARGAVAVLRQAEVHHLAVRIGRGLL